MNPSKTIIFESITLFLKRMNDRCDLFFSEERKKGRIWIFVTLIIFVAIFLLNLLTPMIADDYAYQLIFRTKDYVQDLGDIVTSQINHYKYWGGRSVVHFIAQTLLLLPSWVADLLNTSVFISYIYLIYLHIKGKGKSSVSLFILITLSVWFFVPMFGDTVLWITGSANYLWGTSIILFFLLPYRLYEGQQEKNQSVLLGIVLFAGGIITGWTNENTVVGLLVIIVLIFIYYRSQEWKIPIAHIMGGIGVLIGYTVMILAPGNFKRGGEALDLGIHTIAFRIYSYTQTLFLDYGFLIIIFTILMLLGINLLLDDKRKSVYLSSIYFAGSIAAVYAMILSPQFPPRAWFGLVSFLIIAIGLIYYQLLQQENWTRQIRNASVIVGVVIFIFSYILAYKDVHRMYRIDKERTEQVRKAIEKGDKECIFYMNRPMTKYLHAEDIYGNHLLVHHYGIHIEYK